MPRTCRDCGQTTGPKRRLCKPCTLEARETREAPTPLQTDDGQSVGAWIRTAETWHASVAFHGHEHAFACRETFDDFPAADVSIDHHALAHEHVCPACRAAIDADSMPEPWKQAVADGGTVEDWHGTEAPASVDGVDLLDADACPACESTGTFFEGPAGYFTCERCHSTWAGDARDAEIVTYLEWSDSDKELVTDGGQDKSGLHDKYTVLKNGEPVESCFVLEPDSDPAARDALAAYAAETENDDLAADLHEWVAECRGEEYTHYCEDCEEKLALLYDDRDDESTPIMCGHCGGTNTRPLEETDDQPDATTCPDCGADVLVYDDGTVIEPRDEGDIPSGMMDLLNHAFKPHDCDEPEIRTDGGESSDDTEQIDYDHEVVVDSVDEVTPVPIECPGCGGQFREALTDKLGGTTCHECNDWIRYVRRHEIRDHGDSTEDTTEQAKLIPDGGAVEDDTERYSHLGRKWGRKAERNVQQWGIQEVETLLLAMQEEMGELAQAHLEAHDEDGDPKRVGDELADMAALCFQLQWALNERSVDTGTDRSEEPMSSTDADLPDPWEMYDLSPVGEMRNVSYENDRYPTPDGQVRAYFNGTLMRSLSCEQFSVSFDADPGEPQGLVFQAPKPMFADEEPNEPGLETLMTDDEIPTEEREHDDPNKRVFGPTDDVSWEFEIVVETTPYNPEL